MAYRGSSNPMRNVGTVKKSANVNLTVDTIDGIYSCNSSKGY